MLEKDNKTLNYDHGKKPIKVPFIIYRDTESLLDKINTCHSKAEKLSTIKINLDTTYGYSSFIYSLCIWYYKKQAWLV